LVSVSHTSGRSCDVLILDFDGTVADTMPFLVDLAGRLLHARYGMAEDAARRAYIETTGLPFSRQIEIIFPANPLNRETVEEFEGEKVRHLKDFAFFPDALPAIEALRKQGVKVCLSSGNYEGLIRQVLEARGLEVDLVMGYRPGFEKGPQHFALAASTFGASLERAVFVGDSIRDGLAARQGGVRFVAKTGLVTRADIERHLPGVPIVESLEQVLGLLGMQPTREKK
jgi:phosphoglycolate phosphatase-like HAD superfamily hydrolase